MPFSEVAAPLVLGSFFVFAAYLNLNDPDWMLWSTAYAIGALVCGWTVMSGMRANKDLKTGLAVRRSAALVYGGACLGLAYHSAFLAPVPDDILTLEGQNEHGVVVDFLSSEVAREAGGAIIMAQAMVVCAMTGSAWTGKREHETGPAAGTTTSGGTATFGLLSAVIGVAAIVLGVILPGYLQRAGIAVPAHCGGAD